MDSVDSLQHLIDIHLGTNYSIKDGTRPREVRKNCSRNIQHVVTIEVLDIAAGGLQLELSYILVGKQRSIIGVGVAERDPKGPLSRWSPYGEGPRWLHPCICRETLPSALWQQT